jgi:acyl-ACP thioesterase
MNTPLHFFDETFLVRAYESGVDSHVTLPSYCNYLQEVAGKHATRLGLGIHELQQENTTWMLGHLHLVIHRYAAWMEEVRVRTWPAGMRGRLTALRDFLVTDSSGQLLLQGVSEWLYVDLATHRLTRLPEAFAALAPEGTPRSGVPDLEGKIPDFENPKWSCALTVRQSDHDFNDHVNNVHYVEWGLECLPTDLLKTQHVKRLDISFKGEALFGDTVICEATPLPHSIILHRIRRASDNTTLAVMRTEWETSKKETP